MAYLTGLARWIPVEIKSKNAVFAECKDVKRKSYELLGRIFVLMQKIKNGFGEIMENELEIQELENMTQNLEIITESYTAIFQKLNAFHHEILDAKISLWKDKMWKTKLKICYNMQEIISDVGYFFIYSNPENEEFFLKTTLKMSLSYNNLISMDKKFSLSINYNICNNTCPYLIFPLRKMSVTRLLQIMAKNRAEICCHKLIDCLLENYKLFDSETNDDNCSENSSLEIYKALTLHISPPTHLNEENITKDSQNIDKNEDSLTSLANMDELINYEEKNVICLLENTLKYAPVLLGNDGIKKSRSSGFRKISSKAKAKVLSYYDEILWGEVGNFLEHIILWWISTPLATRHPSSSQRLREWINQFIPTASDVPQSIVTSLSSLADALGVHVTSTLWDQQFRLSLVSSNTFGRSETGQLHCDVLQDLVMLSNQCEVTPEWIVGAPLDELPIVEQIPILHRLDHSVHTTRLWAIKENKKYANSWNVAAFFHVTQNIKDCLDQLGTLRLQDHSLEIEKGGLGVHVQVCILMRAKLVSEININIQKLKDTTQECVACLAAVCRTTCLANLQMIFPPNPNWDIAPDLIPNSHRSYVQTYLDQTLLPVLKATKDQVICNMILKLICESWLDHIYLNKIKFSQYGAVQLLCDFAFVASWLDECSIIEEKLKSKMLKNEILRRCEGVGRLLLRCPGENIKMVDKHKKKVKDPENSESGDLMPPEMYVPNQEQWLKLRAVKRKRIFMSSLCCST